MFDLRPAAESDYQFIWNLGKVTMHDYVDAIWGWDDAWQENRFRSNFDPGNWDVIVAVSAVSGVDAGAIQVLTEPDEIYLSNIYLLPEWQGKGIGTLLVGLLIDRARASNVPLTLNVLKSNPRAKRLYERLGLTVVDESPEKFFMSS